MTNLVEANPRLAVATGDTLLVLATGATERTTAVDIRFSPILLLVMAGGILLREQKPQTEAQDKCNETHAGHAHDSVSILLPPRLLRFWRGI